MPKYSIFARTFGSASPLSSRKTAVFVHCGAFFRGPLGLKRFVGIEEDRDWAFIDQLHGHHGLKNSGGDVHVQFAKRFTKFFVESFGLFPPRPPLVHRPSLSRGCLSGEPLACNRLSRRPAWPACAAASPVVARRCTQTPPALARLPSGHPSARGPACLLANDASCRSPRAPARTRIPARRPDRTAHDRSRLRSAASAPPIRFPSLEPADSARDRSSLEPRSSPSGRWSRLFRCRCRAPARRKFSPAPSHEPSRNLPIPSTPPLPRCTPQPPPSPSPSPP